MNILILSFIFQSPEQYTSHNITTVDSQKSLCRNCYNFVDSDTHENAECLQLQLNLPKDLVMVRFMFNTFSSASV